MNQIQDWIVRYYASHDDIPAGHHDGEFLQALVRCKDCIRWRQSKSDTTVMVCDWDGYEKTENDYCSWAKRKEDADI